MRQQPDPIKIELCDLSGVQKQWRRRDMFLFVLSGELELAWEDGLCRLEREDVCFLRAGGFSRLETERCCALLMYFDLDDYLPEGGQRLYFDLNSSGSTSSQRFDQIRRLLAQMVNLDSADEGRYRMHSLLYALISCLMENFQSAPPQRTETGGDRARMACALEWLNAHYAESVSLTELARSQNLSPSWLSACFQRELGCSFLAYYNQLRLSRAFADLCSSSKTIESIALTNGFKSERAFATQFKEVYGVLPSVFRRERPGKNAPAHTPAREHLGCLAKYLAMQESEPAALLPRPTSVLDAGCLDWNGPGQPLRHNWRNVCCVGSARQLLYADVQDMLRRTQQEIGYRWIKFHGILSDEMMVYTERPDGTPAYSFTLVDKVLDFLLEIGLIPLVQLSFMPRALAADPDQLIFQGNFNVSPPKDMGKWLRLVRAFTEHLQQRYGMDTVAGWPFCVWNEPDAGPATFGWEDQALFFEFYRRTRQLVKSLDPRISFGSPSLLVGIEKEESWSADFFRFCNQNGCPPDFLNIHYYGNDFEGSNGHQSTDRLHHIQALNSDPYAFTKFIHALKKVMHRFHMDHFPVYLTEWNLTISHRDLINDTCFKSCYLVKNLLENYDRLDSFGYWCLTDFLEELPLPSDLYHGGLGLFTYNGLPKAHYNAFCLLTRLGDTLLAQGNGWFVTRKGGGLALVVYNYAHYSKLFASGRLMDITREDRYSPFTEKRTAQFKLRLEGLPAAGCLIKEMYVNQERGSSYDAWTRMGAQPLQRRDELDILRRESQPGIYLHREVIRGGALELSATLEPLEVRLIEIELDQMDLG